MSSLALFVQTIWEYTVDVLPALIIGLFIGGIIYEFIPTRMVSKYIGKNGLAPILYICIIGIFLPLCCYGTIPIALSLYKKGAKLGPVLAFLVVTPATSITALLVCFVFLGWQFTAFIFFSVLLMGLTIGIIGNNLTFTPTPVKCLHCFERTEKCVCERSKGERLKSALRYGFVDMVKEIVPWLILGLILAAIVTVIVPKNLIIQYLSGEFGFLFSLIFGLLMYICATGSVPLVAALVGQGMNIGAGLTLLLLGPVTNYGQLLIIRKEFKMKILAVYLAIICSGSLILGLIFSFVCHSTLI